MTTHRRSGLFLAMALPLLAGLRTSSHAAPSPASPESLKSGAALPYGESLGEAGAPAAGAAAVPTLSKKIALGVNLSSLRGLRAPAVPPPAAAKRRRGPRLLARDFALKCMSFARHHIILTTTGAAVIGTIIRGLATGGILLGGGALASGLTLGLADGVVVGLLTAAHYKIFNITPHPVDPDDDPGVQGPGEAQSGRS